MTHFSTIRSPNQVLTPLKSASCEPSLIERLVRSSKSSFGSMEIAQCFGRHTGTNKWRVVSKNHTTCARLYQTKIFEGGTNDFGVSFRSTFQRVIAQIQYYQLESQDGITKTHAWEESDALLSIDGCLVFLCSSNEDMGRPNKPFRVHFRTTFQGWEYRIPEKHRIIASQIRNATIFL